MSKLVRELIKLLSLRVRSSFYQNVFRRTIKTHPNPSRSPAMNYERCSESAKFLLSRTKYRPSVAIICGTGLGTLGDLLSDVDVVPYEDIPHFPLSTGHNHREFAEFAFALLLF